MDNGKREREKERRFFRVVERESGEFEWARREKKKKEIGLLADFSAERSCHQAQCHYATLLSLHCISKKSARSCPKVRGNHAAFLSIEPWFSWSVFFS